MEMVIRKILSKLKVSRNGYLSRRNEVDIAYSKLGKIAETLHFAGYHQLSNKVRELQSEIANYTWGDE